MTRDLDELVELTSREVDLLPVGDALSPPDDTEWVEGTMVDGRLEVPDWFRATLNPTWNDGYPYEVLVVDTGECKAADVAVGMTGHVLVSPCPFEAAEGRECRVRVRRKGELRHTMSPIRLSVP